MKPFAITFAFLLTLLLAQSAFAWSGAGHMVIAGIAYKELSPETKLKVDTLLKSHPDYTKWTNSFATYTASHSGDQSEQGNLDLNTYVFLRASTWPDEIRRKNSDYDHPQWHYIDYPLRPKKFKMEDAPAHDNDILFGLKQSDKTLADPQATVQTRAASLSWIIHLIGDIHQPLHCASYFSPEFPKGDKGGNSFYVKPATRGIKLHALWDGLLGTRNQPRTQLNEAIRLRAEHPRTQYPDLAQQPTADATTTTDIAELHKQWSLESRALAVEKAYLHGKVKSSARNDPPNTLPKDYTKTAKKIAETQATKAGYRLATELQLLVGHSSN